MRPEDENFVPHRIYRGGVFRKEFLRFGRVCGGVPFDGIRLESAAQKYFEIGESHYLFIALYRRAQFVFLCR
jgi:hypothetical protein